MHQLVLLSSRQARESLTLTGRFQEKPAPEWEGEMQLGKVELLEMQGKECGFQCLQSHCQGQGRSLQCPIPVGKLEEESCLQIRHLACFQLQWICPKCTCTWQKGIKVFQSISILASLLTELPKHEYSRMCMTMLFCWIQKQIRISLCFQKWSLLFFF